jgi:flagellar hook assembly protein FlgD
MKKRGNDKCGGAEVPQNRKQVVFCVSKIRKLLGIMAVITLLGLTIVGCARQESQPLALEITSPPKKAEVTEALVTVSGIVSSPLATVTVDGGEVEIAEDGTFSTTVELEYGENTIVVMATVEGQEPVTKTVTVTRILVLEITSPEDKVEVTESPIAVTGTVSDPSAKVIVNGREVKTAEDGIFSTTVELNYVKNAIMVMATVEGQEPVIKTVTVTRILVLEIKSPQYRVEVIDGQVTVSGVVSPPSATLIVNGREVKTTKDGTFSTIVELEYGENTIVVSATEPVTKTVTVTRILVLEITSPEDKGEVAESPIAVTGAISDPSVTVTVNGSEVEIAKDGTFSTTVELEYGESTIAVSATVEGQELVTKTVTVTRILVLEITSPEDKVEVTESPIAVTGTVSDPSAKVMVNGGEVEIAEDGTFSTIVELEDGENTITVSATVEGQEPVIKTVAVRFIPSE